MKEFNKIILSQKEPQKEALWLKVDKDGKMSLQMFTDTWRIIL